MKKLRYKACMVQSHTSEPEVLNDFTAWMDRMEWSVEQAASALGKSDRMIEYYQAGRPVPLCVLYLMEAIEVADYRPPSMRPRKQAAAA